MKLAGQGDQCVYCTRFHDYNDPACQREYVWYLLPDNTEEVQVGSTKETLDSTGDHKVAKNDVTQTFGRLLKYYI